MKGVALIFFCAIALALGEEEQEIELNASGCPVDPEIHLTIAHETYCNRFYNCLAGVPIEQGCSGITVFNPAEGVCDWPFHVDCAGKGIKEPEATEAPEAPVNPGGNGDPSQAPAICAAEESDGILVANEYCNKYYKCDHGRPVAMDCDSILLWNSDLGICDWPYQVECGDRIIETRAEKKRAAFRKM